MYEVMVKGDFSAAHNLRNYKGKCENVHGHNWLVEAAVSSDKLDENGLLIDFQELKKKLALILEKLDHKNLNDLSFFKTINPTSENIAKFVFDSLAKDSVTPKSVSVWESTSSCATYRP